MKSQKNTGRGKRHGHVQLTLTTKFEKSVLMKKGNSHESMHHFPSFFSRDNQLFTGLINLQEKTPKITTAP